MKKPETSGWSQEHLAKKRVISPTKTNYYESQNRKARKSLKCVSHVEFYDKNRPGSVSSILKESIASQKWCRNYKFEFLRTTREQSH